MSNYNESALLGVLSAASALLEAHENQMVTSEEWDALAHAVFNVTLPPPRDSEGGDGRDERFTVQENILTRRVRPARGTPYAHTCDLDIFENVAHTIDELKGASFTVEIIRAATNAPWSQVAVAIAFLKERGCIAPTQRRQHAASTESVHLDAMVEWHALAQTSAA